MIRGRTVTEYDINTIRPLIATNPEWNRTRISRELCELWDWNNYRHPIDLLETFVENNRFQGTCCKAANRVKVGETTGRSRNDRRNTLKVPIKSLWLYPIRPKRLSCFQGEVS